MTTTVASPIGDLRVTQLRVFRSEWTKLRSLRSTVFSILAAVVFVIGLSVLVPSVTVAHWPPRDVGDLQGFDPTARSLAGVFLAQLAIGVLGVLFISGEYATGMIRASFAAVPTRLPVLWAKAAVFGAAIFAVVTPAIFGAFFIGQSIFSRKSLQTTISSPGVARAVLGAALFLTVVGVLGLALGALLRNTAAGISTLFGLLFVLPIIMRFFPASFSDKVDKYLPNSAGQAILHVRPEVGSLAPWTGFALFCGYAVVALAVAAWTIQRRDA